MTNDSKGDVNASLLASREPSYTFIRFVTQPDQFECLSHIARVAEEAREYTQGLTNRVQRVKVRFLKNQTYLVAPRPTRAARSNRISRRR